MLYRMELAGVAAQLAAAGAEVGGPLTAELITGGKSNLTYRLTDGSTSWVLRMPPRAGRTPSAHDVAREFRVARALQDTEVPVARQVLLCEDESVLGAPFTVVDYVEGRCVRSREDLDGLDDAVVTETAGRLVGVLAALHRVDHAAVGLADFGRPGGYAARQLRRWSGQWSLVAPEDEPVRRTAAQLHRRLDEAVPDQRTASIVHGDYRIDNTILRLNSGSGTVEVAAVVDWELSTIGDPVADVAMMCVYRHPAFDLITGTPGAWTSDRLPDPAELVASYEAAGGVPVTDWEFHLALAHYKIAVIAAGIDHRHRAGAGSGPGFDTAGRSVPEFLTAGLAVLDS